MNAILKPTTSCFLRSAFGLIASAALLTTGSTTHAAVTKEAAALNTRLAADFPSPPAPVPVTIANATGDQLAQSVFDYVSANPNNINIGKVAGEALKGAGSNALDVGAKISAKFAAPGVFDNLRIGTKPYTKDLFSVDAIKTAGSGTAPNLTQVPNFTAGLYDSTGAVALAITVKGTKGASGAVIQGGASLLADGARAPYANAAIDPTSDLGKKLASVVQDVVKGVASTVIDANAASFTNALVSEAKNSKNLLKIIPGIVAGKPTSAGTIADAAFSNPTYASQGSVSPIVKGAAALAKSIGLVADIEQIQKVGAVISAQIPITTVQKGKTVPNIKLSAATGIVSTLAKAIAAKPYASLIGGKGTDPALATASPALVKNSEKADELGELAAYFINALSTSAEFTATKVSKGVTVAVSADKIVTGILKAVIGGGKIAAGKSNASPTKTDLVEYTTLLATYVAGSVALTVANLPGVTADQIAWKASITAALTKTGFAKSLAGASNEVAVQNAINLGLTGATGGRFENGFDVATGALTDPETNIRNF